MNIEMVGRALAERASWLLSFVLLCGCSRTPDASDLILVGIDTLRADHLSLYGYGRETSPNLDAFAQGGMVFERAYAGSSWTLPSMAMLWTGKTRAHNSGDLNGDPAGLAERLSFEGYETCGIVSNALLHPDKGWDRGFDEYHVYVPDGCSRANGWPAAEVVRRGVSWLDRRQERKPRFLFLFLFDPHDPYRPAVPGRFPAYDTPERFEAFQRALPAERQALFSKDVYAGIEQRHALYDAEIAEADAALGDLFGYLERSGRDQRTNVVFFSDHGEGLWQRAKLRGENDKSFAFFPELYFDHGVMLHEEQVRVPLVLSGPGVPEGVRVSTPVATVDVVPTLIQLLGLDAVGDVSGLDLLDGEALGQRRELLSFSSRGASVLMDGRYRLHVPRSYRVKEHQAEPELYDLESDPLEIEPIDEPQILARGLERLTDWSRTEARNANSKPIDTAERARLIALGYLNGEADR